MKISELTQRQKQSIAYINPEFMAENRPKFMAENRPEFMAENRPEFMAEYRPEFMADIELSEEIMKLLGRHNENGTD